MLDFFKCFDVKWKFDEYMGKMKCRISLGLCLDKFFIYGVVCVFLPQAFGEGIENMGFFSVGSDPCC